MYLLCNKRQTKVRQPVCIIVIRRIQDPSILYEINLRITEAMDISHVHGTVFFHSAATAHIIRSKFQRGRITIRNETELITEKYVKFIRRREWYRIFIEMTGTILCNTNSSRVLSHFYFIRFPTKPNHSRQTL